MLRSSNVRGDESLYHEDMQPEASHDSNVSCTRSIPAVPSSYTFFEKAIRSLLVCLSRIACGAELSHHDASMTGEKHK